MQNWIKKKANNHVMTIVAAASLAENAVPKVRDEKIHQSHETLWLSSSLTILVHAAHLLFYDWQADLVAIGLKPAVAGPKPGHHSAHLRVRGWER